jgi:hypothetical protein
MMTKQTLEQSILRQLTYYPKFRPLARIVLKAAVFEGFCGKVRHSDLFEYISRDDAHFIEIIDHFKQSEVTLMLVEEEGMSDYFVMCSSPFFILLELFVKQKLLDIIVLMPVDHFRDECQILLNSEIDLFEKIQTLIAFLRHYKHPSFEAVENLALILDEKILKIIQSHKAALLIRQGAEILKLHHQEAIIDSLIQPLIDLC